MDLKSYIRSNLKKGYSKKQLQTYLLSQGYSQNSIDKTFNSLRYEFLLIKISIVLAILILIIGAIILIMDREKIPEQIIEKKGLHVKKAEPPKEEPNPKELQCQEDCNDFNVCTKDECIDGSCQNSPITPCCGNFECEVGENEHSCPADCRIVSITREDATTLIISQAVKASVSDMSKAMRICQSLSSNREGDSCINEVAKQSPDSRLCGQIFGSNLRDSCYLDFALSKNDFSVCAKLDDRWLKQSCFSYQTLDTES